ncbi:hypothetical protein [Sporosarcina sp. UB5]|uniref:hypothetical protein n=1 Tax=Sporosarcina sp. UB5 TaxID=3047463 RepID=UPI003D7BAB93
MVFVVINLEDALSFLRLHRLLYVTTLSVEAVALSAGASTLSAEAITLSAEASL